MLRKVIAVIIAYSSTMGLAEAQTYDSSEYLAKILNAPDETWVALAVSGHGNSYESVTFGCRFSTQQLFVLFSYGQSDRTIDGNPAPMGYLTIGTNREEIRLRTGPRDRYVALDASDSRRVYDAGLAGKDFKIERHDGMAQEFNLRDFEDGLKELRTQCAAGPAD